ncbi:MAG TPA: GNAT family N-acetyltransferase [Burkholderiaceae bacterium]|nr:GNAT family N-acetyltransferase [Burkholderiaceae bacterium]
MPPAELQGHRVTLRRWVDADLAPFAALNADPEVMLRMSKALARDESDAMAGRIRAHFAEHGFGLWALDVPGLGFAGFVGVAKVAFAIPFAGLAEPPFEIGWRLARAAWGHGYATEGATLALRHAFEVAALPQVVSFAALDNAPSIAVMERIGLTRRGEFDHPRLPPEHRSYRHVLYARERAQDRAQERAKEGR